jgi:hypothetical protein
MGLRMRLCIIFHILVVENHHNPYLSHGFLPHVATHMPRRAEAGRTHGLALSRIEILRY